MFFTYENMDEEDVLPLLKDTKKVSQAKKKQTKNKITWVGEPIKVCMYFTKRSVAATDRKSVV